MIPSWGWATERGAQSWRRRRLLPSLSSGWGEWASVRVRRRCTSYTRRSTTSRSVWSPPTWAGMRLRDSAPRTTCARYLEAANTNGAATHALAGATPEQARAQVVSASRLAAESVLGAAAAPSACRPPLPPPLPTVGLLANGAQVWAPRCICFLSSRHEPLAFKVILHALASLGRLSDTHGAPPLSLPIETALMHIVQSVPLPVSGGPVVRFTIHPDLTRKALSNGNPELSPSTPSYGSTPATQKSSFSDPRGANTPGAAAPTCGLALHLSAPLPTELPRCDYAASLLLARLKPPAILKLLTLLLLEWQLVRVPPGADSAAASRAF